MAVCNTLGGVSVLADAIKSVSSAVTVSPIYCFTGGFLSFFSYALALAVPPSRLSIRQFSRYWKPLVLVQVRSLPLTLLWSAALSVGCLLIVSLFFMTGILNLFV